MDEVQAVETSAEAPTQTEAPATSDSGESTEQVSAKSENRYQKLANSNKTLAQKVTELETQLSTSQGARDLEAWVKRDPKNFRKLMDLMEGNSQPEQVNDPYAQFSPEAAEHFKRIDAMERRFREMDDASERNATTSRHQNMERLETKFADKLKSDGYINADGSFDELEVDLLSDAVLSRATRNAKDPTFITESELDLAYAQIIKGTKILEKRALKQTVKGSVPPPTGTSKGQVPGKKIRMTDDERVAAIAKELD